MVTTLAEQMEQIGATRTADGVLYVTPATTEEVSAVLKAANESGAVVTATGGGTKFGWGNPVKADVVLEMHRMNAILEHTWQDMTVRVQAGCKWEAMQHELAKHRQHIALDPLRPASATVGGIAATNDSGALRLRYGGLRDLIIGMTIVLADGTIARSGGKVVKNVAGYDMHKLMTGAYGTLGVITEVNFRLHPMEQQAQTWSVAGEADELGAVLMKVLNSKMQVSGMQMRRAAKECALDVKFSGHVDCLSSQQEQMRAIADGLVMTAAVDAVWQAREKIFDGAEKGDGLVLKVAMLPTEIAAVTKKLAAWNAESVTQATGIMTAAVSGDLMQMPQRIAELRETLKAKGGSVVIQRMPESLRGELDVWGDVGSSLSLMQRVKQQLDAKGILNRGRFVGGI